MALDIKPYLRSVAMLPEVEIEVDKYPYNIPAVQDIVNQKFHADVTFFVGENGTGKSTVLEAIAVALGYSYEGGTKNVRLQTTDSVSSLHKSFRLIRGYKQPRDGYFLRAESFFNLATYMDDIDSMGSYGNRLLHEQSHGEAFMSVLTNKFKGKGLYLLDEPEAALSPGRLLASLSVIHQLVKDDSQFIIATHSPLLLAYPNAKILNFTASGIAEVKYEQTEHFSITKDFLNNYPNRLKQILEDE